MIEIRNHAQRPQRKIWQIVRRIITALFLCGLLIAIFPFALRWWNTAQQTSKIYSVEAAPEQRVAIVFGARVYNENRLSGMLRDRVETAVQLYKNGQVHKVLMSGGNETLDYNEPQAMMNYAIDRGVPPDDVRPDYGGRRTYDTCYRASKIFQIESAALVTQEFHLPRALLTCNNLGLDAIGVIADRRPYDPRSIRFSETRELPALVVALYDIVRRKPPPILGDPLPIE